MNFAEFHAEVAKIAGAHVCFSAKVEATTYSTGETKVHWSAYIAERGWTDGYPTPELALATLLAMPEATKVEDVGAIPATSPDLEPPPTSFHEEAPAVI